MISLYRYSWSSFIQLLTFKKTCTDFSLQALDSYSGSPFFPLNSLVFLPFWVLFQFTGEVTTLHNLSLLDLVRREGLTTLCTKYLSKYQVFFCQAATIFLSTSLWDVTLHIISQLNFHNRLRLPMIAYIYSLFVDEKFIRLDMYRSVYFELLLFEVAVCK